MPTPRTSSLLTIKRAAALLLLTCLLILPFALDANAQGGPSLVTLGDVVTGEVNPQRTFLGTVYPSRTAELSAETSGRVVTLNVDVGDYVSVGSTIATLSNPTHTEAKRAAEALLRRLRAVKLELDNGSRQEDKDLADAELSVARAELDYWKGEDERVKSLLAQGDATEQEVAEVARQLARSRHEVAAKRATAARIEAGPRSEALLQASADIEAQTAQVALYDAEVERLSVRAPFSGYISEKYSEIGEWLTPGSPVVEILALDEIEVRAEVPEDVLKFVGIGTDVPLTVSATGPESISGTVKAISPMGDSRRRTFEVLVRAANVMSEAPAPSGRGTIRVPSIRAGMSASVQLPAAPGGEGVMVHKDAIVFGGPAGPVVWVADESGEEVTASMVPVQLGGVKGDMRAVMGGVKPGQRVVVRGNERLAPPQAPIRVSNPKTGAASEQEDASDEGSGAQDDGGEQGEKSQ